MSSFLLVCAVVASLAVGVFVAQGLCLLLFQIFRMHARQVKARATEDVSASLKTVRS